MVLSAGVVVVRRMGGGSGWRLLMLRAYKNWDFPKGIVEENEDPGNAAKREVQEETGITDIAFSWGEIFKETVPYRGGKKIARYYIAETKTADVTLPVSKEIGKPEHHEYRWLDCKQAKELASERLQPVIEWAARVVRMVAE
jgi:8-oxo-dGTP pyrophosphatase MutT (NUDIX family)